MKFIYISALFVYSSPTLGPLILHGILDKPRNLDIQRFRGFVVSGVRIFLRYFSGLFGICFQPFSN